MRAYVMRAGGGGTTRPGEADADQDRGRAQTGSRAGGAVAGAATIPLPKEPYCQLKSLTRNERYRQKSPITMKRAFLPKEPYYQHKLPAAILSTAKKGPYKVALIIYEEPC